MVDQNKPVFPYLRSRTMQPGDILHPGMTLLEYYAGQALVALAGDEHYRLTLAEQTGREGEGEDLFEYIARASWKLAAALVSSHPDNQS